ncbi:MAG: hypothetical protein LBC71_08860 [Oscillospiraceae bacterium]|nr:hypothetical protein [Oscillospiraceae bacterium]
MNKIILTFVLLLTLKLTSCSVAPSSLTWYNSDVVESVVISCPILFDRFELTNIEQVNDIVNQLIYLTPAKTIDNALVGLSYKIELYCSKGVEYILEVSGYSVYLHKDNHVYALVGENKPQFDVIINELYLEYYIKSFPLYIIEGTAHTIISDQSNRNVSCDVKTKNNEIIHIDLSYSSPIIDTTGLGKMILREGDSVIIGVNEDNEADRVFIIPK